MKIDSEFGKWGGFGLLDGAERSISVYRDAVMLKRWRADFGSL